MALARAAQARPVPAVVLWGALATAFAAVVAGRYAGIADGAAAQTFAVIFVAIVVEAVPFVLLGAIVSALIEIFVSDRTFERIARWPLPAQVPAAALGGVAFPVCECGSVPVARRLIARGLHPSAGIAFMLAAPVVNPVVVLSTVVAYRSRGLAWEMAAGRVGLGLVLAVVAGWALGGAAGRDLLRPRAGNTHPTASDKRGRFAEHVAHDFLFMGRFLVLGSAIAASLQTLIPQSLVGGLAATPIVAALALMGIAFVLSLCSEADAFVAVSFVQFPLGSQLAFLVFGPVVDAKLSLLYGATFRRTFVTRLVAVAIPVVLAGSLWFEVFVG